MKQEIYKCDKCGTIKKDTNHWWRCYNLQKCFNLAPWDTLAIQDELHLCGMQCVTRALSEFMDKNSGQNNSNS